MSGASVRLRPATARPQHKALVFQSSVPLPTVRPGFWWVAACEHCPRRDRFETWRDAFDAAQVHAFQTAGGKHDRHLTGEQLLAKARKMRRL